MFLKAQMCNTIECHVQVENRSLVSCLVSLQGEQLSCMAEVFVISVVILTVKFCGISKQATTASFNICAKAEQCFFFVTEFNALTFMLALVKTSVRHFKLYLLDADLCCQ
jgi:hypothetical protein